MEEAVNKVDAFIAPSLTSQRKHQQLGLNARIVHLPNFVSLMEAGGSTPGTFDTRATEERYLPMMIVLPKS